MGSDSSDGPDNGSLRRDRVQWRTLAGPVGVAILILLGGAFTLAVTRRGMSGGPDAVAYLSATQNIASGEGITMPFETLTERYFPSQAAAFDGRIPIVLAPPGYPIATGGVAALGVGDISATRWVNAAAVIIGLAAAAWMLMRLTGTWLVVAAGLAMIIVAPAESVYDVTQSWLGLTTGPASEVPFVASTLVALAIIAGYLTRSRPGWAIASVAAVGVALMVRYIGASLGLTLGLAVLIYGSGTLRARSLRAGVLAALTVVPIVAWNIANLLLLGANRPRAIAFHPPGIAEYEGAAIAVADWFLPGSGGGVRLVALLAVAVGASVVVGAACRTLPTGDPGEDARGAYLLRVLVLFVPCYLAFLLATRAFFDAGVPLHAKSLAPIQPVVYIVLVGALWRVTAERWRARRPASGRAVPVALLTAVVVALGFGPAWSHARDAYEPTLLPPPTSEDARLLDRIPEERLVVSNGPDKVFNLAQRPAIAVPRETDATTGKRNDSYEAEVRDLGRLLRRTGGDLVLFRGQSFGGELPAMLGLVPRSRSATLDVWTAADLKVQRSAADGAASSVTYRRARVGS